MSGCNFASKYPWDPLIYNATFKTAGEELVVHPTKPVQYIIIGKPNNIFPSRDQTIPIAEIEAYGEKLRDQIQVELPTAIPIPPGYYEVRA